MKSKQKFSILIKLLPDVLMKQRHLQIFQIASAKTLIQSPASSQGHKDIKEGKIICCCCYNYYQLSNTRRRSKHQIQFQGMKLLYVTTTLISIALVFRVPKDNVMGRSGVIPFRKKDIRSTFLEVWIKSADAVKNWCFQCLNFYKWSLLDKIIHATFTKVVFS